MSAKPKVPQPGIRAFHDGVCPGCGLDIERGVDRVYAKRGQWFHIGCEAGDDDE
jgi:hypothetical protein